MTQTASGGVPPNETVGTQNPLIVRRSLVKKLAEVMALAGRVKKRGRNEHFKYDYAMESDFVAAVRNHLAERHVMLLPSIDSVSKEGKLTTVLMTFAFHDGESGESLSIGWAGCGEDAADKGIYKALTGAMKYVLAKTFLIPTGDDPEATDSSGAKTSKKPESKREFKPDLNDTRHISPEQAQRLRALMKAHNTNVDEFKAWLQARFSCTKADEILRKDYDAISAYVIEGVDTTRAAE